MEKCENYRRVFLSLSLGDVMDVDWKLEMGLRRQMWKQTIRD